MKEIKIPTTMLELNQLMAQDYNQSFYVLKIIEHFERLAIIVILLGILHGVL
jgi:hypothetical protein